MKKIPMTPQGYKNIQNKLIYLKTVKRHKIINAISEARKHGDLSENAEYDSAKEAQALLEYQIQEISNKVAKAQIIDTTKLSSSKITFGTTVTLINLNNNKQQTWTIVGEDEANLKNKKLSITSPIAKALIGKKIGDEVNFKTPKKIKFYKIIKI